MNTGVDAITVATVILAAGASTRLGRPKQLVRWGNESLLERAVRVATEAGCAPIVVLGFAAEEVAAASDLSRCKVVVNTAWQQGMGTSVSIGIAAAVEIGASAIILMTCDQPAVSTEHLRRLMQIGKEAQVIASAYAGRKGVPAYFPSTHFAALQELRGEFGARELLAQSSAIELPFGELDVDTEESLQRAYEVFFGPKC